MQYRRTTLWRRYAGGRVRREPVRGRHEMASGHPQYPPVRYQVRLLPATRRSGDRGAARHSGFPPQSLPRRIETGHARTRPSHRGCSVPRLRIGTGGRGRLRPEVVAFQLRGIQRPAHVHLCVLQQSQDAGRTRGNPEAGGEQRQGDRLRTTGPNDPLVDPYWLTNPDLSPKRRRWLDRLLELGFYQDMVTDDS